MQTFLKVQATSLVASGADFLTTLLCVQLAHFGYVTAGFTGAVHGGLVNFFMARYWTFSGQRGPLGPQAGRFFLVWAGSAAANTSGLFIATHFLGIQYMVAKTLVAILVSISYGYFLQKNFIFTMS